MEDEILDKLAKQAIAYANDPATDRTFLACKFLCSMLNGVNVQPAHEKWYVERSFVLADEFIKQMKGAK